jgi:hypothetical protein
MMYGKKDTRKDDYYGTRMTTERGTETTRAFAAKMLMPEGKNPYYKGEMAIRNIDELDSNLNAFDASEAPWVADWLEYLGDQTTAVRIRKTPMNFKKIIHERREELRRLA